LGRKKKENRVPSDQGGKLAGKGNLRGTEGKKKRGRGADVFPGRGAFPLGDAKNYLPKRGRKKKRFRRGSGYT